MKIISFIYLRNLDTREQLRRFARFMWHRTVSYKRGFSDWRTENEKSRALEPFLTSIILLVHESDLIALEDRFSLLSDNL